MKKLILTILLILTLWSCGTRNTKKTEIKEEEKTEIDSSEKSDEKKEEDRKTVKEEESDIEEESEILIPTDPSKPIKKTVEEKDGKKTTTWENASVDTSKKKEKSKKKEVTDEKIKTEIKKEVKQKQVASKKKSDVSKETERKMGFPYWMLWFLILIPVYLAYKKYKEKKFWFL